MKETKRSISFILAILLAFQMTACGLGDTAQSKLDDAKKTADSTADKAKQAAESTADKAKKSADSSVDKAKDTVDSAKDKAKDTAESIAEQAKKTAESAVDTVKDKADDVKDKAADLLAKIDFDKFKKGWDYAADIAGSKYAALLGQEYVTNVCTKIAEFQNDMNSLSGTAMDTPQLAGYAAEKWHADTFNIDAAARNSDLSASTLNSNKFGSADVVTSYEEMASLKYYNSASGSAEAQAANIIKKYNETKKSVTFEEYFNEQYGKTGFDTNELMSSIYQGQTRIIPADQMDEAAAYLTGRIKKLSGDTKTQARAKGYQETLDNLKTRLEAPDGTASTPATYEEMQAIAELAREGKFDPADFGFKPSQIITPKYVLKQSLNAGSRTAALNAAVTIAPDILSIIYEAAEKGVLDADKLKETGIDGALAAGEGFIEGAVSNAIITACKSGRLGSEFTNASPDVVASLTILAVQAVKAGYSLSKGEITAEEYGDLMAENILMLMGANAGGVIATALFPAFPFAYMLGSIVGSTIACGAYQPMKEMILEIKDGGGFAAIVPQNVVDGINVIGDEVKKLNIKDKVSDLGNIAVSTLENGCIRLKAIV